MHTRRITIALSMLTLVGTATQVPHPCRAESVADVPLAIPLKPDPPPAVDGDLSDWATIPNAVQLSRPDQVVYGRSKWTAPADLSATIRLAWRTEHLYIAADVTDDRLCQTQSGNDLWKGDHLELYLDAAPDSDPQRTAYGRGQFQIGFSPGNFQRTGDPLVDHKPEAVIYKPLGLRSEGTLIAARRTPNGYTLEIALPWTVVGVKPETGLPLKMEIGISDTDGDEPVQESLMTVQTRDWAHTRARLAPAVLAGSDGKGPAVFGGYEVFQPLQVPPREKQEVRFQTAPAPAGRDAVLAFKARLHTDRPAGYTPSMRLTLNGRPIDGSRLVNKKLVEERVNGSTHNMAAAERFTVAYAPDFDSPDTDPSYAFKRAKICLFELRVTDLLNPGDNTLVVENAVDTSLTNPLILSAGRIDFRLPLEAIAKKGPPTGPLPVVVPASSFKVNHTLDRRPDNDVQITIGQESFPVESSFSTPAGKWQKGSNSFFKLERQVVQRDEAVIVQDTFTNLTDDNLPIMQRHRIPARFRQVWLAGLSPSSGTGAASASANPTTYAVTDKSGIGLMALDDVFQVHVTNFADAASIGLADNAFVLKPKAVHTAEWAVILTPAPGYFHFVNAARRLRDVNFTIDGSFAFLRADPRLVGKWSDQQVADFIRNKTARVVCISIGYPYYHGHYPHGTALQQINLDEWRKEVARRRRVAPDAKQVAYYHCYIDVSDGADAKYADARTLRSDGTQANYGEGQDRIFLPTDTNQYGRDVSRNVDLILDDIGFDGVYWDELEYSRYEYHYGQPWDGVSADIDSRTMKIARVKSSVTLLSQPWRIALALRIIKRGPLIGNGAPHTRTMMQLHFPRFVETGSISHCTNAQLYTPIALGDHLTERNEVDAYRVMLRALDYGCVYYWYNDVTVIPTHPHLTQYMFPITPLELGEGCIIGKERILTNRSGLFGWGDDAKHEVHVFDDQGREVPDFKAPALTRDGKTFTELRIAEDWSAAVLRK